MPIYVNTNVPIEELSKQQADYEKTLQRRVRDDYIAKHRDVLYHNHRVWSKHNKDILANYREENRERITEQYKEHMRKKKTDT
jgi:hypothetical protein